MSLYSRALQCMRHVRSSMVPRSIQSVAARGRGGPVSLVRTVQVSASSSAADLPTRIKEDMKAAMKARDAGRLEAIRFLSAAVKQREIELREAGKQVTDSEVMAVINRLVKQRRDSIEQYTAGGRADLAAKEQSELEVYQAYLPQQLGRQELEGVVAAAVAEAGATSVKQMGAVMKLVTAKTAGAADNKTVSELVKAALSAKQ